MTNLLDWNFWFKLNPGPLLKTNQSIFIGLIIFLLAAGIFVLIIKRKSGIYRGFFNRLYSFFLSNAVIASIIFFFNFELIPFFSARFWLAAWFIIMLAWLIFILRRLKFIPRIKKEQEQEKELKKYLP